MIRRWIPPVYSPIPGRALVAGALGGIDARRRLRRRLADDFAAGRVILTDRGTSALQLAIGQAIAGREPVVALPAFGCYDLATAAVGAGVRVALYDVDPRTLGPDPESLDGAFRAGAGVAVIAVLFGYAPDWRALEDVAARNSAILIEDAAQGHGGDLAGRRLGSLGSLAVLSFGRGKGWTGGSGGALLVRGSAPDVRTRHARLGGSPRTTVFAALQAAAGRPGTYAIPASIPWLGLGDTHYRQPSQPRAMPAAAAALLLGSRHAAEREAERRRRNGAAWTERLSGAPWIALVAETADSRPGFLRFPFRLTDGRRDTVLTEGRELGLARTYPTTLAELPVIRDRRVEDRPMPGAVTLVSELVTLPTHRYVGALEVDRIAKLLARPRWTAVLPTVAGRPR